MLTGKVYVFLLYYDFYRNGLDIHSSVSQNIILCNWVCFDFPKGPVSSSLVSLSLGRNVLFGIHLQILIRVT